ncbi:hypothetical protein [Defluviitalea raffinosedens]|uniref:Uncharacterized protein n=1 Tax=Defluviitalea raffinosedens TaxID=1450156 RepID=A0A7C8LQ05_9FIRM|nr:hypothetical protein [Defluviitalea raffinosedens]KAE9634405.1 hypothetical protein GND95_06955 [Defluviitalea raffinosedens]MBM7684805.1 uncharacterized protein YdiU (UPF0061 family) [Defluviitalea raffinosedens]HHW67040.1 hypothetical protein [Candidatus Epulonipiscium sp.]
MTNILTSQQLSDELNKLKSLINDFDYSELRNVTFLNLESLYTYISEVEDNPFQRQYEALQASLDILEPYIPFAIGERAREFLILASQMTTDEEIEALKQDYLERMRLDFVNTIRMIQSEEEWKYLTQICETIRQSKESQMMYQY